MVLNLLDNAVRYTPASGRVEVALETQDNGLRIRVTDNGMGIAPEAAPHVFERSTGPTGLAHGMKAGSASACPS